MLPAVSWAGLFWRFVHTFRPPTDVSSEAFGLTVLLCLLIVPMSMVVR